MSNPQVTAIIPCMTNRERRFIREAVLSVREQTEPCEAIVLVEQSNDWIEQELPGILGVRILRIPLSPAGITRNIGIEAADTEFVAFLDGDDVWLPQKTERQLQFLQSRGADFVAGVHILMREDGTQFAYGISSRMAMTSSWMVRRDVMLLNPFTARQRGQDVEWWRSTPGIRKHRIPRPVIKYRVCETSLSSEHRTKQRKLQVANLSRIEPFRFGLLAATYLANAANRRNFYL